MHLSSRLRVWGGKQCTTVYSHYALTKMYMRTVITQGRFVFGKLRVVGITQEKKTSFADVHCPTVTDKNQWSRKFSHMLSNYILEEWLWWLTCRSVRCSRSRLAFTTTFNSNTSLASNVDSVKCVVWNKNSGSAVGIICTTAQKLSYVWMRNMHRNHYWCLHLKQRSGILAAI